ncbi:sugar transferase [uncultured Pseudokineococcus sp.]|uniref:sugar transferase n=1 Tax=uncultured Pseudokineococcus sp. TaxID=1642928 RepID=UPI002617D138|nr:sugar transferase [uncultured Pseudokineococcus sp.]
MAEAPSAAHDARSVTTSAGGESRAHAAGTPSLDAVPGPRSRAASRLAAVAERTATGPNPALLGSGDAEGLLAAAAATGANRRREVDVHVVLLLAVDLLVVVLAAVAVELQPLMAVLTTLLLTFSRASLDLYRRRLGLSVLDEMPRAVQSTVLTLGVASISVVLWGATYLLAPTTRFLAAFLVLSVLGRLVVYAAMRRRMRRHPEARRRTLVLGAGAVGTELAAAMQRHPEQGLEPVGFVDGHSRHRGAAPDVAVPVLSQDETRLHEALERHGVETVVVAYSSQPEAEVVNSVIVAASHGCEVLVVPRLFELQHDGPDVESLRGTPLVRLRTDVTTSPAWLAKTLVDRVVAGVAVVLLAPVLLAVSVAVVMDSGFPVLFRQERVGLWSRPITLLKFRSMRPATEEESRTNWNIAGDARVSPIGRFLRKTSLDELPQLFNILRGDMSLVGPRPERPAFVQQFSRDHDRYWARHRVPVGLTGWSQVNGLRGDTSIQDRSRYDNYYIANWSLWLDAKIILLTLREVLRGSGG